MKKYSAIISAVVLGFFVLSSVSAVAAGAGAVLEPKVISKEDAAKKYPPPAGKEYPLGINPNTGGQTAQFFQSPYSSRMYDCRKIPRGSLVLDEGVNKVFRKP